MFTNPVSMTPDGTPVEWPADTTFDLVERGGAKAFVGRTTGRITHVEPPEKAHLFEFLREAGLK